MAVFLTHDDALALWREALSASIRSNIADLSVRQMAILLTVYTASPPHTVRALSKILNISKPVVSRAVETLNKRGLIKKRRDSYDRRSIHIQRTAKGTIFLLEFANYVRIAGRGLDSLIPFAPDELPLNQDSE